jgi:hypothetical protein
MLPRHTEHFEHRGARFLYDSGPKHRGLLIFAPQISIISSRVGRNNGAVIMNLVTKILFLVALAAGLASTEASAATCQGTSITPGSSDRLLCTKTFYGTETCNSSDQLATLTDSTG